MNAIVLAAPPEVLSDFQVAAAKYPFAVRTSSAINRPLLTSIGADLRAVFAMNITRAWSLGRLAAVIRGQNREAVMSLAFAPTTSFSALGTLAAQRWFARTVGGFIDDAVDPWAWSTDRISADFPPSSTSPAAARRFTQSTMRAWDRPDRVDDTVLIVSELVTNSIEYSSSTSVIVDLAYTDGNVYVAVSDTAVNSLPVLRRPGQGTHAGRGLRIVGSSATWWGVTAAAQTKTVWAELGRVRPPTSDAI